MQLKKIILETIISIIILLFLYTAISKFLDFDGFKYDMNNQPFPNAVTPLLIWAIPLSELAIVVALLFDRTREAGLFASLILMGLFTIYTSMVMLHGFEYIPCSCGGVIKHLTWPQHVVFNLFFVTISIVGIKINRKSFSRRSISGQAT